MFDINKETLNVLDKHCKDIVKNLLEILEVYNTEFKDLNADHILYLLTAISSSFTGIVLKEVLIKINITESSSNEDAKDKFIDEMLQSMFEHIKQIIKL